MDVSQSVTPAEFEPEPDSTVPIRGARPNAGLPILTTVDNQSSAYCSQYARNRDEREPVAWLIPLGYGNPGSVQFVRDLVLLTQ